MWQCGFIDGNQRTALIGDVDSEEGVYGKCLAPSAPFCYEPKTALKNKSEAQMRLACSRNSKATAVVSL